MNIRNSIVYKSLLILVMAVIFLCASAGIGLSPDIRYEKTTRVVQAEENPVYAAYLKKGGSSALYQLADKQQSSIYLGKNFYGSPVKWSILKNGTLNNASGTMIYTSSKNLFGQLYYQYFTLSNSTSGFNTWATSQLRSYLNGTPYASDAITLNNFSGTTYAEILFGDNDTLRNTLVETQNSTLIYYDNGSFFSGNGSHLNTAYKNNVENNYDTTKASFEEIFEYTNDYLFLLSASDITAANGFTFLDDDGNPSPTNIVNSTSVNRNSTYTAHADGVKVGNMDLRNSVRKGTTAAARMVINANGVFDSVTTSPMTNYQIAANVRHSDFIFAICGSPESDWVNGTVESYSGNRPVYKLYLKNTADIGSTSGIFPTSAYVLNGKLNIDFSNADGNNYIDHYMVVVKDENGNVVSSRGVALGNYQGVSALALDDSVLEENLLKSGYTVETFGYKSTGGYEVEYCTDKAVVQVTNKKNITLSLNDVTYNPDTSSYELEARTYGDAITITAFAVETDYGVQAFPYDYVIQYNDENISGEWTTTVPVNAGRYAVRAYGAPTENYMEAISDVAYLVINPRQLEVNFIDDYKISNTEGGTRPYNGQPYVISAEFTNVVSGDNLIMIKNGGNEINASDTPYTFIVYGFSAGNSTIASNYSFRNTSYHYTITRATATIVWSDLTQTYDGTQKDPTVAWESAAVVPEGDPEVVAAERINAGSYTVTAEYNGADKDNFTINNVTQDFTINKATATVSWSDLSVKYDGTQKNPSATWETAEVLPTGTLTVVYEERVNAGTYTVTVEYSGEDNDNFNIVNDTASMTIERVKLFVSISARAVYGQEAVLRYIINTFQSDPIPESEIDYTNSNLDTVTFETDWTPSSPMGEAYYAYVAGHNVSVYEDYDLMPNYKVEWRKAIFWPTKSQITSIMWSEDDYTYNAAVQTVTATGRDAYGQEITLEITFNKEFKNAATDYVATAAISDEDSVNFNFGYYVVTTKNYTIKRATATVSWSDLSATYDGTQKVPTVTWESAAITPESAPEVVAAERINAGSYTVNAEYNGADKDNFTIANDTATFVINPRELAISFSDANGGTREYDGTAYEVGATFTNVVSGDTVVAVITGESGVNASDTPYIKTVSSFTVEGGTIADNYVLPSTGCDYSYTITKRNVTVSWTNTSFTYNAQAQKPTATWTDSVALNAGSELSVSGEQVNASSTPYVATVAITGADENNFTITNDTQNFTIGKRNVSIVWGNLVFTYDGTQKVPTASWGAGDVLPTDQPTVNYGEMINAGTYSVNATYEGADKDNFTGTYSDGTVTINKLVLWVDLNGYAIYGQEATLSWAINEEYSNPIPASETDYVNNALNSVTLETDWTPYSDIWDMYYVIVSGHDESMYIDETLMSNYIVEWVKGYFNPGIATIVEIIWSENDYTYNGAVQVITAQGKTANNIVIDLAVTVNKEFKNAAADYVATADIKSEDLDNFEFASEVVTTKDYEIKRATATVSWSDLSATYSGTQKTPTVTWESAAVTPESAPEIVAAERINAGSYTVNAEYNGADKDNFTVVNTTETLVIARAEIGVTVTLDEDAIIFGSGMQAHAGAAWLIPSEEANNALLGTLITGYNAGDNVGTYLITLDFEKAEDESRRSPETFLDNYVITVINAATLTVNKKTITASDLNGWISSGDVEFKGKTVLEDGRVHMIYAKVSGEAANFIKVSEYLDKNGETFTGASAAANYQVTAVFVAADDNYETDGITLSAILRISAKVVITDEDGNERGYIIGLDPEHDYDATLIESDSGEHEGSVDGNAIETKIVIKDENGNPVNETGLTVVLLPPQGYDAEKDTVYVVDGGVVKAVPADEYTFDEDGNVTLPSNADGGTITFLFGVSSGTETGTDLYTWFFWIVVTGATIFGFIAILVLIKKLRDEYAGK